MSEFDLIARIRARAGGPGEGVLLGIGDDAALLQVPAGRALAVATDTLNAGVHFPDGTPAAAIGWKALAVNLSDLAAMGAVPAWATLSLSLPAPDADWLDGFLDGFLALALRHGLSLVGGDTTRGPLSIGVTVLGSVRADGALRRDGARAGDDVWVTGTLGDAAAALAQWRRGGPADPALRARLDRPEPRIAAGLALAGLAHAAIDISDGLLADLGHVCARSGVGAAIDVDALPCSEGLAAACRGDARRSLQATGGDDYELCFTAAREARAEVARRLGEVGVAATRIGRVDTGCGLRACTTDGAPWTPAGAAGYAHFG